MQPEQPPPSNTLRHEIMKNIQGIRRRLRYEVLLTVRALQFGVRAIVVTAILVAIVFMMFTREQNTHLGTTRAWLKLTEDNLRTLELNQHGDRVRIGKLEVAVVYLLKKDRPSATTGEQSD